MRFKIWLRGPADNPRVEMIGDKGWDQRSDDTTQRGERSLMAELLTLQEAENLQTGSGRWLLPGTPP
jgi:hypothetical protein